MHCFANKYVKLRIYVFSIHYYQDKMFATYRDIGFAIIVWPYSHYA